MPGPGGRSAGRVSVRVVPDSTTFREDLKKALTRIERTVTVSLPVTADVTRARAQIASFARELRSVQTAVAVDTAAATAQLALLTRPRSVSVDADVRGSGIDDLARSLTGLTIAGTGAFAGMQASLSGLAVGSAKGAAGLAGLATAASGLVTVGGGAVLALGAIAKSAALLPALGAAGAAGIATLGLAFTNLGEATGDAAAVRETVKGLSDEFQGLRSSVQAEVFKDLAGPIQGLVDDYLPALTTGLSGVGAAFNSGFKEVIEALRTPLSIADTATGLENTRLLFEGLGRAAGPFTEALRDISVVGSTFFAGFGDGIAGASERFAAFIAQARETGALQEFMASGITAVGDLTASLGNLGGAFSGIFEAANINGGSVLSTIASITGALDALVNSAPAQSGLTAFFDSVQAGLSSFLGSVSSVLPGVLAAVGPLAGELVRQLGPIAGAILEGIGPVVEVLAPALQDLVSAVGPALTGYIQTLGPVLGALAEFIAPVITAIAEQLGPALASLGPFITDTVAPAFRDLGAAIGDEVGPVMRDAAAVFKDVALPALSEFAAFMRDTGGPALVDFGGTIKDHLVPKLKELWTAFKEDILPALQDFGTKLYEDVLPKVLELAEELAPLVDEVLDLALAISDEVGPELGDLAGTHLKNVIDKMTEFADKLGTALEFINDFIDGVNLLRTVFAVLENTVKEKINSVLNVIRTMPTVIQAVFDGLATRFRQVGADIIAGIVGGITAGLSIVRTAASNVATAALEAARAKLGIKSPSTKFREVGEFINAGLADGITGSVSQVEAAGKKLADAVTDAFLTKGKVATDAFQLDLDAQVDALKDQTKDLDAVTDAQVKAYRKQVDALNDTAKAKAANAKQIARLDGQIEAAEASKVGRLAEINARIEALQKQRGDAGAAFETQSLAQADQVLAGLRDQNAALLGIATQREAVAGQIEAAQKRLEEAVKLREDFAASVRTSAASIGALVGIKAPEGGALDAKEIAFNLREARNKIQEFSSSLLDLRSKGLSESLYRQLAQAGAEGGSALAKALQSATPDLLKEINTYQEDLEGMAEALGSETSGALFTAGVDAATGLVRGLESQSEALRQAAERIAATLTDAVKKALGIASPSRVFRGLGVNVGEGFTGGIDSQRAAVAASARALTALPTITIPRVPSSVRPSLGGAAAPVAGATVSVVNNYQIERDVDFDLAQRRQMFQFASVPGLT